MPSIIPRLLLAFIILSSWNLSAQDKIYFASSVTPCKITDVTTTTVTYLPLKSSKSVTVYVNKLLFLFNERGLFLQPSKLDFSLKNTQQLVKKFLHDEGPELTTDRIYKTDKTVVDAAISKEDKAFVYLDDENKIDKKAIAAIIYKDGSHQVFGSATRAAEVLWAAQESSTKPAGEVTATAKKEPEVKTPVVNNNAAAEKTAAITSSKTSVEKQAPPAKNTEAPQQETSVKLVNEKVDSSAPAAPPVKPTISDFLPTPAVAEFEKKAQEKTMQFSNYLKIICSKSAELEEKTKAINQAVLLFINDDATVEVSSLNRAPVKRKIKDYLDNLQMLNYDRVELVWTNVQYVTDIKRGMDGNYYGTITFEQEFKGYRDGKIVYSDVTMKKSVVILRAYEKVVDGITRNLWEVLLGDIGVEATRSI